ncbi:lasso peptide isopeptide bond-forming cyclase [Bacillus rhizoplanae]|uniref:lasso peptide isopeptide bond-forming cyclase n=1 Tax=Bacillus rhizoplanae TaxID=2880966 RepID=UPI003D1FEE48
MSAITGILHFNDEPISIEHGTRLMKDLQKYPADDVQIWHKDKVFLGCHAQWITPESIGEQLPFYDYERQLAITADAIIDNRDELFERLQVDYADRKKMTDSELILLSYQKWGEETPKYLVGDFAFMIWDERNRKLFGARDFSGSRTLYFYRNQQRFAFCTTIQPLQSLPYVQKQLNEQWLAEYLAICGMVDVADATMTPYKNIEQVPPSYSISVVRNIVKLSRYCTLTSEKKLRLKSNEEYVEAFREVFQEAVVSRLRTYRQVGAQLSGGLDSGSIVSFAAKVLHAENKPLHTFSYIPPSDFEDFTPKNLMPDERPLIKETVRHVGGIKDYYLDFEGRDPFSEVEDFLEMMEMPYKFFENSFWLKGMFEEGYKEGIGVLLNGGRGNLSISWGSAMDYYALLLKRLKWVRLTHELHQYSKNVGGARLRRLPVIARIAFPFIDRAFSSGTPYTFPTVINPDFAKRTNVFNKLREHGIDETGWFSTTNVYEQRRNHFEEVFHWNASNTLATKLSLRYSLWKRDPTNDIRVIRFCLSVPEEQYVQNGLDRALIRRSTEKFLPDKVRLNQHIQGVQGADWVHRMIPHWNTFLEELEKLSTDKRVLEFLDSQVIKKALLKVREGAHPERAIDPNYKILMRSLIVYRFIQQFD